jgi:hypothetical protein
MNNSTTVEYPAGEARRAVADGTLSLAGAVDHGGPRQ